MIHSIHIESDHSPIILERIMSTTRVRGYRIRNMEIRSPEPERYGITLTVESEKPNEKLINQLRKICGISHINALHPVNTGHQLHAQTGT